MYTMYTMFLRTLTTTSSNKLRSSRLLLLPSPSAAASSSFHASSVVPKRRRPDPFVPQIAITKESDKEATSVVLHAGPNENDDKGRYRLSSWPSKPNNRLKLKKHVENTLVKRQLAKVERIVEKQQRKEEGKKNEKIHDAMRRKILKGTVQLSYREIQRLCKENELGAKGTHKILQERLFTFFRRVDPENVKQMGYWELINIRDNLDDAGKPDNNPDSPPVDEKERRRFGRQRDKENGNENRVDDLLPRWKAHFVADLTSLDDTRATNMQEGEALRKYELVAMGKFFAVPSPTSRATCRECGDKILKGTVRVSEHVLTKFYSSCKVWSVRQSEHHRHAICFLNDNNEQHCDDDETTGEEDDDKKMKTNFSREATLDDLTQKDTRRLRDTIMKCNEHWEKDKEWNHMMSGPVMLRFPANGIKFGFDHDQPSTIRSTAIVEDGMILCKAEVVQPK